MKQSAGETVFVEAPARLHFGVLDLRGESGRWFGGIGAAAPEATLLVSASKGESLEVEGEDALRAEDAARRFLAHHEIRCGARVRVHRALPAHAGLGSGTQMALAVARALAELYDIEADVSQLSRAVGRARRSAIGSWTFAGGGLVVEGGRHRAGDACGPLIARLPFPPTWRCVVAVPDAPPGISGAKEATVFAELPPPSEREVERVAHIVLMALLPAVADDDLAAFGSALNAIQEVTGRWFAPAQGGTFAPGPSEALVRAMADWGALGVGQSSWGPTVYGIVEGEDAGRRLADRVGSMMGGSGKLFHGPFRMVGARLWHS